MLSNYRRNTPRQWRPLSWEREGFWPWLADTKSLPHSASTEITAHRNRINDEADQHPSASEALTVKMKKTGQALTGAHEETKIFERYATAHKRSAKEAARRLNDVKYDLVVAWARITQLTS